MPSHLPALPLEILSHSFEQFASHVSQQACPLYARLSGAVAADPELLALASHARRGQPVPNLFFAAIHFLLLKGVQHPLSAFYPSVSGVIERNADPYPTFRSFCLEHREEIRLLLATRLVQTNEVGRCACLLPAFALIAPRTQGQPLSLVEIGSSAGLNLLWDRYSYDYGEGRRYGALSSPVQIACTLRGNRLPPFPTVLPEVTWRLGIDLHPLSVSDPEAKLWLQALIWPENAQRAERLQQALHLTEQEPPSIMAGDALALLPSVLASVPQETTLCVFHSLTVNQFSREARERLTLLLAEWAAKRLLFRVSLESYGGAEPLLELTTWRNDLATKQTLAVCDSHAQWLEWQETP